MLYNLNPMNYSHHIIFKYIGFMSNHYISAINLDVMSLFNVFSKINYLNLIYY